jgi:hypothetical protein
MKDRPSPASATAEARAKGTVRYPGSPRCRARDDVGELVGTKLRIRIGSAAGDQDDQEQPQTGHLRPKSGTSGQELLTRYLPPSIW